MKSLRKSHKNTSDRHGNNGFIKHTKFPTRFICYGKFRPHFKTKKSNNIQIFANPTGLAIPPCYGRSTPSDFESHSQFSLAESKRPSWQHEQANEKPANGLHINSIVKEKTVQWKHFRIVLTVLCLIPDTQPKTPQTYCKLSILPACQQLPTSLSISSSCKKSVKIRLVANCHLQTCKLKQLAINLQQFYWNDQIATSLLTTCNWLVVTSCRKPCERILIYRLVVTSCYKMSTDLLQLARFWLCRYKK